MRATGKTGVNRCDGGWGETLNIGIDTINREETDS